MISKNAKQEEIVDITVANRGRGFWDICPGFGKTTTAIKFIKFVLLMRPHYTTTIVVPTHELKDQWEEKLTENGVTNFVVRVINGIIQGTDFVTTHICIIDEVHCVYRGPEFSKIFELVKSPYFIGMSGTITPACSAVLQHVFPLIVKITKREAERNGWINVPTEYNLFVEMGEEEMRDYNKVHELCEDCFAHFHSEFNVAMDSTTLAGALQFVQRNNMVAPGMLEIDLARNLNTKANVWRDAMSKRIALIHSSKAKLRAVAQLVNELPNRKIITFGMLTAPADSLTTMIHGSKALHGNLQSVMVRQAVLRQHRIRCNPDLEYVLCPVSKLRKLYVSMLRTGELTCMNTVRMADLGLDVPGVDTTIIYGRDSVKEKAEQREARGTRFNENVKSLIINVIVQGTKDVDWLKRCQKGKRVTNFNSVTELVNDFKTNILHV